ncbi:MAG: hypothetical protein DYG83_09595 [Candidatus Brocadia sp. AMX2]|uniref:F5/8 type C domain-containing protein n=1 Tax=Candidatus Brocadia sinica JPN1 TaxID=1197129 RepID=A0ABQ0JXV2_9BACT|nr:MULTISPECIES: hypothetical protein [Brocadia]MBC6932619.1 hypothetical protein [Candidatus Brocadia sp.]MBL1169903.1 hypothetical protein [Candidatus Brocadia sp. AMX1]MCK6467865.1 hypothetical protein [Candidatus Brocadia sinica]NOG40655.1 hypothetical protein [Planctomycetota bacterium]KAA0244763.1 MAG: hypothetical protein EDM70_05225 [Candidatus Brocadia sp. AMX2]
MSVSFGSFILDVQNKGTATVKIFGNQGNPLSDIMVVAKNDKENIATVTPNKGLTNSNGQISFTINGISNGIAIITFTANTLSDTLPLTVVSNIAPCAMASSSGGGRNSFGPKMMNDGKEKDDCSYHWVKTRNEVGQKKNAWIRLDWNRAVTLTRMTIQTTDCNESCGEDSDDPFYIDPGRNLGNGLVQYLSADAMTWVTDDEFVKEIGDIEYSFTKPITTRAIRIRRISPSAGCKGQQSNPIVFEWKVYGTPSCK